MTVNVRYIVQDVETAVAFYERLGFAQTPFEELPESAQDYFKAEGDYPDSPDHRHFFMIAR